MPANVLLLIADASVRLLPDRFNHYFEFLSVEDRKRLGNFRRWQDAQLFLFGRLLLKRGMECWGCKASIRSISFDAFKKPMLVDGPCFSISHAGDFVVCAICDHGDVGIDIELIHQTNIDDFKDYMHNNEWDLIGCSTDPVRQFFHFWTRKEALIKADGRGLLLPLAEFDSNDDVVCVEGAFWFVHKIHVDAHYCCHLATRSSAVNLKQQFFLIE